MKYLVIFLITLYQWLLSPIFTVVLGAQCRYPVSCSEYTKQQISAHGLMKGSARGLRRLLSCHPFGKILGHA